jgi:hypothetical protein
MRGKGALKKRCSDIQTSTYNIQLIPKTTDNGEQSTTEETVVYYLKQQQHKLHLAAPARETSGGYNPSLFPPSLTSSIIPSPPPPPSTLPHPQHSVSSLQSPISNTPPHPHPHPTTPKSKPLIYRNTEHSTKPSMAQRMELASFTRSTCSLHPSPTTK